MAYEVYLTEEAEAEFDDIIDYLERSGFHEAAGKLTREFVHVLTTLESFPFMFPTAKGDPTLSRAVLLSKSVMYYRVEGNKVMVKSFLDGRRERAGL